MQFPLKSNGCEWQCEVPTIHLYDRRYKIPKFRSIPTELAKTPCYNSMWKTSNKFRAWAHLHFDLLECHQVCSSNRVCEAMGMFGIQTVVVGEPANNSLIFPLQIFRSRAKEGVHVICSYIPSASISSTDSPRRWYRHGPRLQTYPGSMIHLEN